MASNSNNSYTNHHAYYPNAHRLPRQTRSPESYASLARRNHAAEMLQSYEKVSWLASQRVESIAQTRLYLQNIIAGFNPDDPRGNPVEWEDSTYQQQRRRAEGEGGGKGKARVTTTNGEESSTGGEGSSTSGTGARRGANGTPRRKPGAGGGGGGG